MQRQVPRVVEETDVPVPRVMEEIIEVMQHGPQEHEQGNTVEQRVDVQDPLFQEEIAELNNDHKKFYEQFVKCTKLGIHENSIDELLRLNTSKSGDEQISLKEYVGHMKEGQNDISHITGESIEVVSSSSFRENLRKKGYEVLYMADPVDEFAVQQLKEFDGKTVKFTPGS